MVTCISCVSWRRGRGRGADDMAKAGWGVCDSNPDQFKEACYMSATYPRECARHKPCEHAVQSARVEFLRKQDSIHRRKFGPMEDRSAA